MLSHLYAQEIGFDLITLRVGTMCCPGDKQHRLIPTIITKAIAGEEILLNSGEGLCLCRRCGS